MDKIEAIIDAISKLNGVHNPDSTAYVLRNPLLVRSFALPGKHEMDEEGRRVFSSIQSGYKAAYFDLELKIAGKSRSHLTPESTLTGLLGSYGIKELLAIDQIVKFLKRALKDDAISRTTPLSYFQK